MVTVDFAATDTFRKVLLSSVLLAGPGVLLSMVLTAGTTIAIFGFDNECVSDQDTGLEVCGDQVCLCIYLCSGSARSLSASLLMHRKQ